MANDSKPHPSEFLEFTTISPTLSPPSHVEQKTPHQQQSYNDDKTPPQLNSHGITTSSSPPGSSEESSNELYRGLTSHNLPHLTNEALAATQSEHRMTFRQGLRLYPKAIGWSAMISMAIIMEGFDTALINSYYGFPEFQRAYGVPDGSHGYQITTHWQSSISNGSVCGAIIGLFANGILTELFGYRHSMMGALLLLAAFIFLSFFAYNIQTILAGQILCGLSWGLFSTLTTTYAAEVMPLNLRAYLTANVNLCWLFGQIIALGTLRGLINVHSAWSYKIPFGLQWVWIAFIFIAVIFAPESPWWLVRNNRLAAAKKSLLRLTRRNQGNFNADATIAMMEHTNAAEQKFSDGRLLNKFSYIECFRGANLRRTEIACCIFAIQNLCGLPIIAFSAYYYQQLGFSKDLSFDITLGMHGLAICGNLLGNVLMKHFGRRRLYLVGLNVQFVILLVAGVVSLLRESVRTLWAMAGCVICFIFVFDTCVGPLTYTLVAEIPSTRLRVKTVVLARVSYNVCAMVTNVIQQHMLNPLAWDWKGRSSWFWAGSCAVCILYCYYRLPETRGLTYLELDILFEKKASARKFKAFQETLASTGYFSFYRGDGSGVDEPEWKERRPSLINRIGMGLGL